jgi:hypothetical protein
LSFFFSSKEKNTRMGGFVETQTTSLQGNFKNERRRKPTTEGVSFYFAYFTSKKLFKKEKMEALEDENTNGTMGTEGTNTFLRAFNFLLRFFPILPICCLDQIGDVHRHLVDLGVVELLDVFQRAPVRVGDEVDSNSLPTETSTPSNPENENDGDKLSTTALKS